MISSKKDKSRGNLHGMTDGGRLQREGQVWGPCYGEHVEAAEAGSELLGVADAAQRAVNKDAEPVTQALCTENAHNNQRNLCKPR